MKKIIIIGGGFAGAKAASKLERTYDVTLIDQKDYFEFTPSILRTIVEPAHIKKIQVRHSHYLHHAHLVQGEVENISKQEVIVNGKSYQYDYLIITSGSSYHNRIKGGDVILASRAEELRKHAGNLVKAKKVMIIGGGIVGVELAAEIAEKYPHKEIILIHSRKELMERSPKKVREYAKTYLERKGVQIIFDEKIINHNGKFVSSKDNQYTSDITFLCVGIMPNYKHLGVCSTDLNERNFLCVNKFMQVQSYKNVFAAGDITNIKEEKTAQAAETQASTVVRNIINLEKSRQLEAYASKPKPMVISLGKKDGILIYKDNVLTGWIPAVIKSLVEWKAMRKYR